MFPKPVRRVSSARTFGSDSAPLRSAHLHQHDRSTQCVTVDTDDVHRHRIHLIGAYLGSFDPNNICTNWIGESGGSQIRWTFSFEVSDGQTFVVVVSEVTPNAGCLGLYRDGDAGDNLRRRNHANANPRRLPTGRSGWADRGTQATHTRHRCALWLAQTATHFYVFGGVPWHPCGRRQPHGHRHGNLAAARTDLFASEAPTCALMEATGIVYCAEGDTGSSFASYDIATNTWTPLAPVPWPPDHYGSASGAFNGKVFVAATTAFSNAVQVYDVATNTWSAGTAAPNGYLLAGYQQVGQYLYVVGGWTWCAEWLTTTTRLNMSSAPGGVGKWASVPHGQSRLRSGLRRRNEEVVRAGRRPRCDGGFFNSTNEVDELDLSGWPGGTWVMSPPNLPSPNRQANQAGFYGNGDIWSVGGINGATFQFLNEVWHRNNGGGCPTPNPTPTATPTATPRPHQRQHRRLPLQQLHGHPASYADPNAHSASNSNSTPTDPYAVPSADSRA